MLTDLFTTLSDKQAITASAPSTNVYDNGIAGTPKYAKAAMSRDIGKGDATAINVQVTEAFNNLTSLTVALEVDDAVGFGTATVVQSVVVPVARLTAGRKIPPFYLPEGMDKRYWRLNYTVTGTAPTTGKISAALVFGRANWKA